MFLFNKDKIFKNKYYNFDILYCSGFSIRSFGEYNRSCIADEMWGLFLLYIRWNCSRSIFNRVTAGKNKITEFNRL